MKNKTKFLIALVAVSLVGFSNKTFAQRMSANINFSVGGGHGYYGAAPAYGYNNVRSDYGHNRDDRRGDWGRERYANNNRVVAYREPRMEYRDRDRDFGRYNNGYNNYNSYGSARCR